MYETENPVLIIVFNRPEQTNQVFEVLRVVRPKRLYIAADAARQSKDGESKKCAETLSVFDHIDWPCEVFRKVNDKNLGSHTSIPQAIDWFFDCEEMGIVLEDDCLPSVSFFRYCDELLEKYRYDKRIMWVNGSNIGYKNNNISSDYYFSIYAISWGWASWRRAWSLFDGYYRTSLPVGVSSKVIKQYVGHSIMVSLYWRFVFKYAYAIKNWDYRWLYTFWSSGGLACTPKVNMISNIGFGVEGMHGGDSSDPRGNIPANETFGTIKSPAVFDSYTALDEYLQSALYKISFFSILKMFVASRFPWLRNTVRKIRNRPV